MQAGRLIGRRVCFFFSAIDVWTERQYPASRSQNPTYLFLDPIFSVSGVLESSSLPRRKTLLDLRPTENQKDMHADRLTDRPWPRKGWDIFSLWLWGNSIISWYRCGKTRVPLIWRAIMVSFFLFDRCLKKATLSNFHVLWQEAVRIFYFSAESKCRNSHSLRNGCLFAPASKCTIFVRKTWREKWRYSYMCKKEKF